MKSFRNRSPNRPQFSDNNNGSLFAIVSIIPNIIAIAILIGIYYYLFVSRGLFPDWVDYAYWTLKILIGYNILAASARSLLAPLLTLAAGATGLYVNMATTIPYFLSFVTISTSDAWQLIGAGGVGLLITLALKL